MPEPVFHRPVIGAATRALVIGVGHYPSLPGGDGHQMKKPEGLQQLQSPPVSAREFARWLIANYQSVDRPLATVQLHISEKDATSFIYEVDRVVHERQPQLADMATVKAAIRHWYTLGNENPDDLMLFYFGGHGLCEGALLISSSAQAAEVGRRVLVGWNGTRAARRAIADAMPMLVRADYVELLMVDPSVPADDPAEQPGAELAQYLMKRGVKVSVRQATSNGRAITEVILDAAREARCDLVVLGAYSRRSRFVEALFGGVTRSMLSGASVHLFIS